MRNVAAAVRSSLTARLLIGLILPTAALALLLGVGGAWAIDGIVERVNDRLLEASARAIADTVALEDDAVTLDLPASAFGMLENDERDNVYYSVRKGNALVTGYPDLPVAIGAGAQTGDIVFDYAEYRGERIRLAAITRRVPRLAEPVVIQVGETLDARIGLRSQLLRGVVILEAMLILLLLVLLPIAVRWGLAPLLRLRREIDARSPTDFTPLASHGVAVELRSLLEAFNGLLARLQEAVAGMRRFSADASHQMRTPLSILQTHLTVIRREGLDSVAGRDSFADVEAAAARLQRLVTQLLALARAEGAAGAVASFVEPVEMVALARRVAETYVPVALSSGVELQFDARDDPAVVASVEVLAHELLANLVDNAIRYNRAGGWVCIAVQREDTGVLITVEDDGPGIPAASRGDMFRRFRRLVRDQKHEGSGLGLAIVATLAEAIGAEVSVAARTPHPGMRARIAFPGVA
jgi:two-component system sensor histidine kinase TctE